MLTFWDQSFLRVDTSIIDVHYQSIQSLQYPYISQKRSQNRVLFLHADKQGSYKLALLLMEVARDVQSTQNRKV